VPVQARDKERFREYLADVKAGKSKINAGALKPHELVEEAMQAEADLCALHPFPSLDSRAVCALQDVLTPGRLPCRQGLQVSLSQNTSGQTVPPVCNTSCSTVTPTLDAAAYEIASELWWLTCDWMLLCAGRTAS